MERRKFLEAAGLLVGSSVLDSKSKAELLERNGSVAISDEKAKPVAHHIQPCISDNETDDCTTINGKPSMWKWNPQHPTIARIKLDVDDFTKHEKALPQPADFVVGLSDTAINKLLAAHYINNPNFYDRSRERVPNCPVFEYDFDDHGTVRKIKFWAKVVQDNNQAAVSLELIAPSNTVVQKRFAAWWKCQHNALSPSKDANLPPNVHVLAPHVVLQLNFPKLDGSGDEHKVDLSLTLSIFAYLTLDSAPDGKKELKLTNWDIQSIPNDDPLDPNDPIWGHLKPGCEDVELSLRLALRDALVIATEILLANLSKNLVQALPLPPINVVQHLDLVPRELYIEGHSLAVTASLAPTRLAAEINTRFKHEMETFENDLMMDGTDLQEIVSRAPSKSFDEFDKYMLANVPAYAALAQKQKSHKPKIHKSVGAKGPLPNNDFFVMLAGNLFDQLAKALLVLNQGDCTDWFELGLIIGYVKARSCYWLSLSGGHGDLNNTTISMGADVRAGGGLEIRACTHNPCGPDPCLSWNPGLGLKGPVTLDVHVDGFDWAGNKALWLSASFSKFPGFEVYGLPPGVEDVVNLVLNFLTGVALQIFFNAILSFIQFPLIVVPVKIPEANVTLTLHDFGSANVDNMLVLTGTTDFS